MYVIGRFLAVSVLVVSFTSPAIKVSTAHFELTPAPAVVQTVVSLAPFSSVELHSGGTAILRYGPTQGVTFLKGSADCTDVTVADGGRLVIESYQHRCPRRHDLEIEIVTPDIARISVAEGGAIQSRGSFPRQAEIRLAVSNGGTIDVRSMAVDSVTASVDSGGRIFAMPQTAMIASVVDGGIITYWGDARVIKSVQGGGVVTRGTAADLDKPLAELDPPLHTPPTVPALPPIQPLRNPRR